MQEQLIQNIVELGVIDWIVTLTALVYVVLSARNNPWCWPFGIISAALWAYASYFQYQLYADALLQLFYVLMGFIGLHQWLRGGTSGEALPITSMKSTAHWGVIVLGIVGGVLFGYAFSYTDAAATYWDALTTSFSILATILLVRRQIENWLYWIIIDLAYSGLYFSRGAILFALLMLLYVLIAGFAYQSWSKAMKTA